VIKKGRTEHKRKSYIEIGEIYFWTATINNWQQLLQRDEYKQVIVESLEHLSSNGKIDVFAFVIMPNHIHLIWRVNELNGKETAQGSFLKFTAHEFKKMLIKEDVDRLEDYAVKAQNKKYEFWQRDPLAIPLYTRKVAYQKLDYIHYNPMAGKWKLVKDPCDYKHSTARFYEIGVKDFAFIKDLREEF
jgi:putative transposase